MMFLLAVLWHLLEFLISLTLWLSSVSTDRDASTTYLFARIWRGWSIGRSTGRPSARWVTGTGPCKSPPWPSCTWGTLERSTGSGCWATRTARPCCRAVQPRPQSIRPLVASSCPSDPRTGWTRPAPDSTWPPDSFSTGYRIPRPLAYRPSRLKRGHVNTVTSDNSISMMAFYFCP